MLHGYEDSDWAGDSHDAQSAIEYIFRLGKSPITWNLKKQPIVAPSSPEVEYHALAEAAKTAP